MEDLEYCSNCKKKICAKNYTIHSVHCKRNVVICNICNTAVSKSQYKVHLSTYHATLSCPECCQIVDSCDLLRHQKEDCIMRNTICKYCDVELKSRDVESHMEFCASRTERCKGCTKHVQKKFIQFHYENDHKYMTPEEKGDAGGSDGDDGEECPICLGPIILPIALECGHVFCMVCVKGIAGTTKNCAICRRDINRNMLMDIRFCCEKDVIKNYVKNPKCKKFSRSKSVPSRSSESRSQAGTITQDYDSMVSALLSNKVSSSSYRYERPTNTHTPPIYTPYCYSSSSFTMAQPSTSNTNFTSTSVSSYLKEDPSSNSTTEDKFQLGSFNVRSRIIVTEAESSYNPCPSIATNSITTASSSFESRPRRPTSLALSSSQEDSDSTNTDLPQLTQEEYDRWLAFQLSRSENDIPPDEFNNRNRNPMRRSISMPERKNPSSTYTTQYEDSDDQISNSELGLPPTAPRNTSAYSPTKSTTSRQAILTKSSSDPQSSGSANLPNTGTRPKCATALRKRVSFREEVPPKREAPVMLPCEFCNEMFCERDLMRHQTGCDFNETQNPREFLLARRSSAASSLSSPTSPVSPSSPISPSTSSLPPLPSSITYESSVKPIPNKIPKTPPHSPSVRLRTKAIYNNITDNQSSIGNHHIDTSAGKIVKYSSLSPESGPSASSGICSATSSFSSSVSTTPSTSSSASPIPASTTPDTPTDVEADMEEEDVSVPRPRRGRFLSSAISSWRSISGSRGKEKSKYSKSNTDSVSDSKEDISVPSISTVTLMPHVPNSDNKISFAEVSLQELAKEQKTESFVKNRKSYKAPLPPPVRLVVDRNETKISHGEVQLTDANEANNEQKSNFHFDSMPIMNGQLQIKEDVYHCENCQQPFTLRKLKCHQTVCKKNNTSFRSECLNINIPITKEIDSALPIKYKKGPAPQPPSEDIIDDESILRSNSRRRRSGSLASPDDISNFSIGIRLERDSIVKETSKFSRLLKEGSAFLSSRKWMSREVLFGGGTVEGAGSYSGNGSLSSSTTSLNSLPGSSVWTSNVGIVRDELRSRRAATSLGLPSASVLLGTSRYRERSLARSRPSSLYSSSFYPHLCV